MTTTMDPNKGLGETWEQFLRRRPQPDPVSPGTPDMDPSSLLEDYFRNETGGGSQGGIGFPGGNTTQETTTQKNPLAGLSTSLLGPETLKDYMPDKSEYFPTEPVEPTKPEAPAGFGQGVTALDAPAGQQYREALKEYNTKWSEYAKDLEAYNKAMKEVPENQRKAAYLKAQAIGESYKTTRAGMESAAAKSQEALGIMKEQTAETMGRLGEMQERVQTQFGDATKLWQGAVDQAEGYAKAAPQRTLDSLNQLKGIYAEIDKSNDFARSHDMQVVAQSVIGSSRESMRNAADVYGKDSNEYRAAKANTQKALGAAQSSVIGTWAKIKEAQRTSYLNASAETLWRGDMYGSFQEQQHVETMRYYAQSSQAYSMQVAQFDLGIEQLKIGGMENLANWIMGVPDYSMDMAPYLEIIADTLPPMPQQAA